MIQKKDHQEINDQNVEARNHPSQTLEVDEPPMGFFVTKATGSPKCGGNLEIKNSVVSKKKKEGQKTGGKRGSGFSVDLETGRNDVKS